jgi:hypothetical protein
MTWWLLHIILLDVCLSKHEEHEMAREDILILKAIAFKIRRFHCQCPGFTLGVIVGSGGTIGVPVPPGVGETDGVTDGVAELVGEGMAVLVGVGDTRSAVKNAGDVRLQVWPFGAVKLIWISTT